MPRGAGEDFIEHDSADADQGADADETPVDIGGDDALGERRNQTRLRSRQRRWPQVCAGRAHKTVRLIYQVEYWRNDDGPGEDTDNKRELLLPRSGLDELTGLEVLQVIVRDCGHIEDDRG